MEEAVSPELALVDPDLARRLRAQEPRPLYAVPALPDRHQPQPAPSVQPAPSRLSMPTRAAALVVMCAVLGGGGFAAAVAATRDRPVSEAPTVTSTVVTAPTSVPATAAAEAPPVDRELGEAQRELLALIPAAVREGRLPKGLLDPETGLVRNGSVAVCAHAPPGLRCTIDAGAGGRRVVRVLRVAGGIRIAATP